MRILLLLAVVCGALTTGCATMTQKEMEEKYPLKAKYQPRWETNEIPYEDAKPVDRFGRNIRDGFVGLTGNFVQAGLSVATIGPWTGFAVQKLGTIGGDIFGLIDDNGISEHVFKGIFSRHLLRFGAQAEDFTSTMGKIHDTEFEGPELETLDYVGNKTFHWKVYGAPSSIATLGTVVVSDLLIRPAGNFVLMFQGHDISEKIDKAGLDVIQLGLRVPFF